MGSEAMGLIPVGDRIESSIDADTYARYEQNLGHKFIGPKGKAFIFVKVATAVTAPYTDAAGGKCLAFSGAGAGDRTTYEVEEGAAAADFAGVVPPSRRDDNTWPNGLAVGDILYVQCTGRAKVTGHCLPVVAR